jgi:hypothetical protein
MTVQGTDISCDQCGLVVTTAIRRGPMPGRPANEPVRAYAIAEKGWGIEGERDLCPSHVASRSDAHEMAIRSLSSRLRPAISFSSVRRW